MNITITKEDLKPLVNELVQESLNNLTININQTKPTVTTNGNGHKPHLTPEQRAEVKFLVTRTKMDTADICGRYNVHYTTISGVRRGKLYKKLRAKRPTWY